MTQRSLTNFPEIGLTRLEVHLTAIDRICLPHFPGSVFRGGFGAALRRTCCTMNHKECRFCILNSSCVYASVFETASEHVGETRYKLSNYPRPFIIEPPFPASRPILPGQSITCGLILGGHAVQHLPYFLHAFQVLGKSGLGSSGGRCRVDKATGLENELIFDGISQRFTKYPDTLSFESIFADRFPTTQLLISFATPTRIKFEGRLTKDMTFELLMKNLLRRISLLVEVCTDKPLKLDYKAILKKASKIRNKESRLRWHDWQRYSSRQKDSMKLGGFLGETTFEGDLSAFVPFLRLGEYLHIGKACTFGLGKYEMQIIG